jgi:hypothetical protein
MPATPILRYKAFWQYYTRTTEDPLNEEVLRHFGTAAINGRTHAEAVLALPIGSEFSLQITISPDLGSVDLGLQSARTNQVAEMGWMDDARSHPHAVRWSELEKLYRYWLNRLPQDIHPSAAFLLLAIFVGHGADEADQFAARKDAIAGHYQRLQLFSPHEIAVLAKRTFVRPIESDYNWSEDDELGWVFGGHYPCYSLRNRAHSDGAEGRFPFSNWLEVLAQLPPLDSAR